eukprot:scaffold4717_cov53-Attheya_sp.AAC.5
MPVQIKMPAGAASFRISNQQRQLFDGGAIDQDTNSADLALRELNDWERRLQYKDSKIAIVLQIVIVKRREEVQISLSTN